jgi:hypothetical protein
MVVSEETDLSPILQEPVSHFFSGAFTTFLIELDILDLYG